MKLTHASWEAGTLLFAGICMIAVQIHWQKETKSTVESEDI